MKFKACVFLDEEYDNIQIRRSAAGGGAAVRSRIYAFMPERVVYV